MKDEFIRIGESVTDADPYPYLGCGLEGIFLCNGYEEVTHDGDKHVIIRDIEGLHWAIGRHLVAHRKALEPAEIRFIRKTMGLTQADLAGRLSNDSQTVARWEKGSVTIPGPEERLVRALFMAYSISEKKLDPEKLDLRESEQILAQLTELRDFLTHRVAELDTEDSPKCDVVSFEFDDGDDTWLEQEPGQELAMA